MVKMQPIEAGELKTPGELYAHVFWKLPEWERALEVLCLSVTFGGDLRSWLKYKLRSQLYAIEEVGPDEWLNELLQDQRVILVERLTGGSSDCPTPGPRDGRANLLDFEPDFDTTFNFVGWYRTVVLNAAYDELEARQKVPRLPYKHLTYQDVLALYCRCSKGKQAVKKWYRRLYRQQHPHPLIRWAVKVFLGGPVRVVDLEGKSRIVTLNGSIAGVERLLCTTMRKTYQPAPHRFRPADNLKVLNSDVYQDLQDEVYRHAIRDTTNADRENVYELIPLHLELSEIISPFAQLRIAFRSLNPIEQATLRAYYFRNHTDADAAKEFGITTAAFNKRRERAEFKLARRFFALRNPQHDNLALIDLAKLSDDESLSKDENRLRDRKKLRHLLYGHCDDTNQVEFEQADVDFYVEATSLVSEREPKEVFGDANDPWDVERSKLYVPPLEPRPPLLEIRPIPSKDPLASLYCDIDNNRPRRRSRPLSDEENKKFIAERWRTRRRISLYYGRAG